MLAFAPFYRCFILFLIFSSSLLGESIQWQSSYILMRNGKVVGTESFTMGNSDGFNLISGKLLVSGNLSEQGGVLSKKFRLRALPPFFEPVNSVISVSENSGVPVINRAVVDNRTVNFQGEATKVAVAGASSLLFIDPHCNITFSALIQAYDMSVKGVQKFEAVDTGRKQVVPIIVDYRGEDALSAENDADVRCFTVRGFGSEEILLKVDRFGKILFIRNSYGDYDAFLEGTMSNAVAEMISQPEDTRSSSKALFKEIKVAIGLDKTVVEASFYLPGAFEDKLPAAIVLSDIDDGGRSFVNTSVISVLMEQGFAVLKLPLSRGFNGDVNLVKSSIDWLRKRQEVDSSKVVGAGIGLSFAPLWEVVALDSEVLAAVALIDPPLKTASSLVLSELDGELSNDGFSDELRNAIKEKFQRFLHNMNTQSQGYQGLLKHSINEVKGWEFELLLRMVSNPGAFDGYVLTFFPGKLKLLHIPLFIFSTSTEVSSSLHKDRLQEVAEKHLSPMVAVNAVERGLSDNDYRTQLAGKFKNWIVRFLQEK